jgi:hypothetical protein
LPGFFAPYEDTGDGFQVRTDPIPFENDAAYSISATTLSNSTIAIAYKRDLGPDGSSGNLVIYDDAGLDLGVANPYVVAGPHTFAESDTDGEVGSISAAALEDGRVAVSYANITEGTGQFVTYGSYGTFLSLPTVFEEDPTAVVSTAALPGGDFAVAYAEEEASGDRGSFVVCGKHRLTLARASNNEVRLWNHTNEELDLLLSVDQ